MVIFCAAAVVSICISARDGTKHTAQQVIDIAGRNAASICDRAGWCFILLGNEEGMLCKRDSSAVVGSSSLLAVHCDIVGCLHELGELNAIFIELCCGFLVFDLLTTQIVPPIDWFEC